jgi:type VI secretion system secreted protein Hcp
MATPTNIDAFLLITDQSGDIKNESIDKNHPGLLQIQNFSFGVELQSSPGTGTGMAAGKSVSKQFEFDVNNSKASPILFSHCCDGTHCKSAVLYIRKAGGTPQDYYVWKFKDLVITKFEVTCSDDILEKIAFAFSAIWCEYKPQKPDGSLDSGINSGWDVKTNAPWGGSS